jgi:pyruvate dehydrogenase E2 component (dihydrolipoamide acetyltransferase)
MAQEASLDLRAVKGTGLQGEITKGDVEKAIAQAKTAGAHQPLTATPLPEGEVVTRIPVKGIRSLIAERMSASVHTTARFTLFIELDATKLVRLREELKARVEKEWGFAPSYNDLMAKIVGKALRKFPYVNARLTTDAIEHLAHVHIGMATDTDRGLMVPVIRDVDQKNLRQFGTQFRKLVEQARTGHIALEDLKGGTFTITNLGSYDILTFVPVINLPEAAILANRSWWEMPLRFGRCGFWHWLWTTVLWMAPRLPNSCSSSRMKWKIRMKIYLPDLIREITN